MLSCLLNNKRINCYDYDKETLKKWANKNILICPACGKPYEYCHGKVISPYFRHKDKQECIDRYSEPETEEHKIGKQDLYEWIKKQDGITDIILEGWIESTKQRPDIMFKYNGEQYVIEYQCSPIASEYYERHELYQASGINDIWILGTEKYLRKEENEKSFNFKRKEIENNTNFYYDSEYKLFGMSNDYIDEDVRELMKLKYATKTFGNNIYCKLEQRKNSPIILLNRNCVFYNNIFTKIDNFEFSEKPKLKDFYKKELLNYYEKVNKIEVERDIKFNKTINFLKEAFEIFRIKKSYDIYLADITNDDNIYFYMFGNEFFLFNINNYPNLSLFSKNEDVKHIFNLDISKETPNNFSKKLYRISTSEEYYNSYAESFYKENKEFNRIKKELSKFSNKNIYLLFSYDRQIDDNIRFKFIKNYYDDEFDNAKNLLREFKFLEKIKAKDFVFMIPYKKIRYSKTSIRYPSYKVRNYEWSVISDFESLGFKNIYFYDDLIKKINK